MSKPFHQLTNSELDILHNTNFPKWQIAMRIRKNYQDALAKRQAITANRQARIAKRDALQGKFKEAYNYKLMSLRNLGKFDKQAVNRLQYDKSMTALKNKFKEIKYLNYYKNKLKLKKHIPYKNQRLQTIDNLIKTNKTELNYIKRHIWNVADDYQKKHLKEGNFSRMWQRFPDRYRTWSRADYDKFNYVLKFPIPKNWVSKYRKYNGSLL